MRTILKTNLHPRDDTKTMSQTDRRAFLGYLLSSAAAAPVLLSACQSGPSGGGEPTPPRQAPAAPSPTDTDPNTTEAGDAGADPKPSGETERVKLEVGDNIKYSTTRIAVKAGSTVELTLEHTGKLPKEAMGHNFVLLEKGTNMNTFANAAMGAVDNQYVPKGMADSIIAHTKVVGGGESDTISFAAPAPGEYTYLCTFPGHYMNMNGKLVVS